MIRTLIAAAMLTALAGCGLRGDLERPPPLFGEARAQYEREQAAAAETARQEELRRQQARDQLTPTSPSSVPAAPINQ